MNNAHLYIDDLKIPIEYLDYQFRQFTGTNNRPRGGVFGGEFSFTFDIIERNRIVLIEWMLSSTMRKDGYIEIQDFTNSRIAFKLEFKNAYATNQNFNYDAYSNLPLQANILVTAGAVRFNKDVVFLQTWNPEDPFVEQEATVVEDSPKNILNYFLTDLEDNELEEYDIGDKILLQIETQNRIGDKVTIDLDDKTHDFTYNGNILENDTLQDYVINGDLEKIELEVIEQAS